MHAYILIKVGNLETKFSTLEEIRSLREVKEANKLLGPWDIIAEVEVNNENEVGKLSEKIRSLGNVKDTLTLIAEK